jgi:hypothetical protein
MADLSSFSTPEKVRAALPKNGWEVVLDDGIPTDDPRPPFHVLTVDIKDFSYLGQRGRLRLGFFNHLLPGKSGGIRGQILFGHWRTPRRAKTAST